jgi:hypothetical protein
MSSPERCQLVDSVAALETFVVRCPDPRWNWQTVVRRQEVLSILDDRDGFHQPGVLREMFHMTRESE